MPIRIRYVAALAFVPLTLTAGSANASDLYLKCGTTFTDLRSVIDGAATFVNRVDQTNLSGKVDGAALKVQWDKISDAADILLAISEKVTTLATAQKTKLGMEAKLGMYEANAIRSAAGVATACLLKPY